MLDTEGRTRHGEASLTTNRKDRMGNLKLALLLFGMLLLVKFIQVGSERNSVGTSEIQRSK